MNTTKLTVDATSGMVAGNMLVHTIPTKWYKQLWNILRRLPKLDTVTYDVLEVVDNCTLVIASKEMKA